MSCVWWPDKKPKSYPGMVKTWKPFHPIALGKAYKSSRTPTWTWLYLCVKCGAEMVKATGGGYIPTCECSKIKKVKKKLFCQECGKEFTRIKGSTKKYCSSACSDLYFGKNKATMEWKGLNVRTCTASGDPVPYSAAIGIVQLMIEDAKTTITRLYRLSNRRKLSPSEEVEYLESKRWLQNGNGGLYDLLSGIKGVNIYLALLELWRFAEYGHKEEMKEAA